jgi:hypothetical protein
MACGVRDVAKGHLVQKLLRVLQLTTIVSGSPPTAPVVSKTSGTVYEKALIERYIEENGTDPLSGEALTLDDLVDVKASTYTSEL